jgi:hypothetical protein
MNAREAKRQACWTAAGLIESHLTRGGELRSDDGVQLDPDGPEYTAVSVGMRDLVDELTKRSGR